jgi:hypothetical protein
MPLTDEWKKKIWYVYTKKYYPAINKNEIMAFIGKWLEVESFMLSKLRHVQKVKVYMFSLICAI